jgi:hypothetical protein
LLYGGIHEFLVGDRDWRSEKCLTNRQASNCYVSISSRSFARYRRKDSEENQPMQDLIWIGVTIAFFALSVAYVKFCDWVK